MESYNIDWDLEDFRHIAFGLFSYPVLPQDSLGIHWSDSCNFRYLEISLDPLIRIKAFVHLNTRRGIPIQYTMRTDFLIFIFHM